MLSAAVPAFMLWLFVVPERGLYNRHGAGKVAFAAALFLAGLAIVVHFPEPATALIQAWMSIKPSAGYIR